ncbi:MAG: multidrug transporter [Tardiphaga sp.]|jgi:multidrug efflux system outer membrane protein|nr:multidrug transporter [Tardiphaga sp.]
MRIPAAAAALLPLALMGCSLNPDYLRPELPVSEQYPGRPAVDGRAAADIGWAQFFTDPVMQDLIALSLDNNRDLRVAALNVIAAQAQYRAQRSTLFPTVNALGTVDIERIPPGVQQNTTPLHLEAYNLGLSTVSYELDLFGKLRSQADQSEQQFLSSAETRESTQITLIAQVASQYFAWLADQEAIRLSKDTAEAQRKSYELRKLTLSRGSGTELDVAQAETTWRTAEASVAQYTRQAQQDYNELILLVGSPLPAALEAKMAGRARTVLQPRLPRLPAGMPADLLLRRPDIRAAERTLIGANANIGAARAAFFPSVTLTASGGTGSGTFTKLFRAGTASWAFDPQISVPIFDAGKNIANLDYSVVQKRIEVANYEKAIQSAFHDVSDALAGRATYATQVAAQEKLVKAYQQYYNLSKMLFEGGSSNFLNVLVAQNSLFSAQLTLVNLRLAERQNLVTLYKALGGGWSERVERTVAAR